MVLSAAIKAQENRKNKGGTPSKSSGFNLPKREASPKYSPAIARTSSVHSTQLTGKQVSLI